MGGRVIGSRSVLAAAAAICISVVMLGQPGSAAAGGPKPRPTPTPPPPAMGEAIFATNRITTNGVMTFWAVAPDGTALRQVGCWGDWTHGPAPRTVVRTEEVAGRTMPIWSGSQGTVQTAVRQVVSGDESCGDTRVLWSPPDGVYIAGAPTWSQDGRRIAFSASRYDTRGQMIEQGIWVGELDGSCGPGLCSVHLATHVPMTELARDEATGMVLYGRFNSTPRWSTDGRSVVYTRGIDGNPGGSGIFVADLGTPGSMSSTADVLVPVSTQAYYAAFSPVDPDRIAFVQGGRRNICRTNDVAITTRSGEAMQFVTNSSNLGSCAIGPVAWSPDGAWIAFNAVNRANSRDEVWKIRPGASKATLVLSTAGAFYSVSGWR